jgi:WD40 repeat protein
MFRVFIVLLVAFAIAGGVAYGLGWLDDLDLIKDTLPSRSAETSTPPPELGDLLYPAVEAKPLPEVAMRDTTALAIEPCHVMVRDKQPVSCPKDGKLLYIGTERSDSDPPLFPPRPLISIKLFDGMEVKTYKYRPLEEGDIVEHDQIVAVVDPALAMNDLLGKSFKVAAAIAEHRATESIFTETKKRLQNLVDLKNSGKGIVTVVEMGDAEVAVAKYAGDEKVKKEAINTAKNEEAQAEIVLRQHFLRCELPGKSKVKKIFKSNGGGIKAEEDVVELHNLSRLRIEGAVDSQFVSTLRRHMDTAHCYLEPSVELHPHGDLMKAHRAEVTSVAVCYDGEHFVSGSEDHSVYIWKQGRPGPLPIPLVHKSAVRVVACSPKSMHVLVGCADGSLTMWDLTDLKKPQPTHFPVKHRGPVTALAFSPDANFIASGGEDNAIFLWKAGGEQLYGIDSDHNVDDPHQGTVTSLHFTPQCTLVSAARDNTLRVWELHKKGAKQLHKVMNRGGAVSQLGIKGDGSLMLFDKGKTLQLMSVADGSTVWSVLDNLAGTNPFETLALFSPDGELMLTGSAGEGRLHLWKTPTPQERAFRVRELVTTDHSAITSAAFFPGNKRFAVTGSKDGYVHLWKLPGEDAVNEHVIKLDANKQPLRLDLIDTDVQGGKTRVAVNVYNPPDPHDSHAPGRLTPGQPVTLVVVLPGRDVELPGKDK